MNSKRGLYVSSYAGEAGVKTDVDRVVREGKEVHHSCGSCVLPAMGGIC